MSDRPMLAEPMDQVFTPEAQIQQSNMPVRAGDTMVQTVGSVITAQRVAVPRDLGRVMQTLKALSRASGQRYIYSWEANDRQNRRKVTIEGLTIKAAMDIVRSYGNCVVDVRAFDQGGDHIMFYARFVDLETGFSLTRAFQQRKSQSIGMKDADRAADIVFQIGQSKAIRNVVLNALPSVADYVLEEANSSLLAYVENNREKALAWVQKTAGEHRIAIPRIEAVVGRRVTEWTVRDLTKVLTELRGVDEGLSSPADLYPTDEDAKAVAAEKDTKRAEGKQPEPKPEPEKKAEPDKAEKPKSGGKGAGKKAAAKKDDKPAPAAKAAEKPADGELDLDDPGKDGEAVPDDGDDEGGAPDEAAAPDEADDKQPSDEEADDDSGGDEEEEPDDGLGDDEFE